MSDPKDQKAADASNAMGKEDYKSYRINVTDWFGQRIYGDENDQKSRCENSGRFDPSLREVAK